MTSVRLKATLLGVMLLTIAATGLSADEPSKADAIVTPLATHDLAGVPGKEVSMVTVEYPPGASSKPHRHNANVYVYVLEGSVIMQVEGKDAMTLQPGQTFYENPDDVHVVSANASKTKPAKFLVVIVKDKGAATTSQPAKP
jgi:quercetin dioxygenase-like cupin family protein